MPSGVPGTRIRVNPGTLDATWENGIYEGEQTSLEEWSAGRLTFRGRTVYDTLRQDDIAQLGMAGESRFIMSDAGDIQMLNAIQASTITGRGIKQGQYGVAGDVTVTSREGTEFQFAIPFAGGTERGMGLVYRRDTLGNEYLSPIAATSLRIDELQQIDPTITRFAPSREVTYRAVLGEMSRRYREQISDLLDAGSDVNYSGETQSWYELAGYLVEIAMQDPTAVSSYIIQA